MVTLTRGARLAAALWIVWAVILWNVVFDQVLVFAARHYVVAALVAANGPGPYARIDDWLGPAVTRAFWAATVCAMILLAVLFAGLRAARASERPTQPL
jgi:hypothetical protein